MIITPNDGFHGTCQSLNRRSDSPIKFLTLSNYSLILFLILIFVFLKKRILINFCFVSNKKKFTEIRFQMILSLWNGRSTKTINTGWANRHILTTKKKQIVYGIPSACCVCVCVIYGNQVKINRRNFGRCFAFSNRKWSHRRLPPSQQTKTPLAPFVHIFKNLFFISNINELVIVFFCFSFIRRKIEFYCKKRKQMQFFAFNYFILFCVVCIKNLVPMQFVNICIYLIFRFRSIRFLFFSSVFCVILVWMISTNFIRFFFVKYALLILTKHSNAIIK